MFAATLLATAAATALVALPFAPDDEAANPMTFSQSQWGGKCGKDKGTDPGCLRDDNFTKLFPDGLVIGDADGADITVERQPLVLLAVLQGVGDPCLAVCHVGSFQRRLRQATKALPNSL